jgi:hypothetical protein
MHKARAGVVVCSYVCQEHLHCLCRHVQEHCCVALEVVEALGWKWMVGSFYDGFPGAVRVLHFNVDEMHGKTTSLFAVCLKWGVWSNPIPRVAYPSLARPGQMYVYPSSKAQIRWSLLCLMFR